MYRYGHSHKKKPFTGGGEPKINPSHITEAINFWEHLAGHPTDQEAEDGGQPKQEASTLQSAM